MKISKASYVDCSNEHVLQDAITFVKEHPVHEAYAYVWNKLVSQPPANVATGLLSLVHELERQMAFEHMKEHGWERDDSEAWQQQPFGKEKEA